MSVDRRQEDHRQEDYRQVDSRVFHNERRHDLEVEDFDFFSAEIEECEKNIKYYNRMKKAALKEKQRCQDKLKSMLKRQRLKKFSSSKFLARIKTSPIVFEVDKNKLPEKFRRYSFEINKSLIHKLCLRKNTPPEGTEFRMSETISVSKI